MVEPDSRSGDGDVASEFSITGGLHWAENGDKTNNMSDDRHTVRVARFALGMSVTCTAPYDIILILMQQEKFK